MKKVDLPKINDNVNSVEFWNDINDFLKNPTEIKASSPKMNTDSTEKEEKTA